MYSRKLGKFIAGFSQNWGQNREGVFHKNCLQTSLNSVTDEDSIKHPFAGLAQGLESILSYQSA